jgi:hypothetical protein
LTRPLFFAIRERALTGLKRLQDKDNATQFVATCFGVCDRVITLSKIVHFKRCAPVEVGRRAQGFGVRLQAPEGGEVTGFPVRAFVAFVGSEGLPVDQAQVRGVE